MEQRDAAAKAAKVHVDEYTCRPIV